MIESLSHIVFALGGGLGAVARHMLAQLITHRFPISTLLVNVTGSLMLGAGIVMLSSNNLFITEHEQRLVFGFCGGFTTFSSFAYQTIDLHRKHRFGHAAINIAANLVLCFIAFCVGGALFRG